MSHHQPRRRVSRSVPTSALHESQQRSTGARCIANARAEVAQEILRKRPQHGLIPALRGASGTRRPGRICDVSEPFFSPRRARSSAPLSVTLDTATAEV